MEVRCRIYRKLEKWRELEMVVEGCLHSVEDVTRIHFACHHAAATLERIPYTVKPTNAFRVWIPMRKLTNALVVQ